MAYEFQLVSPELRLDSDLRAIKRAILRDRRNPIKLTITDDDFAAFAPRFESDWGELHASLPGFHTGLLSGAWRGREAQSVPTSLLGDFGEFISAEVFRRRFAPGARVARVIRPTGLQRPDFIIFDPRFRKVTALESKAATINAERLRKRIRDKGKAYLTVCSTLRSRRQAGLDQIADAVKRTTRVSKFSCRLDESTAMYGRARIPAHRSAIATPYFPDGRALFGNELETEKIAEPKKCGMRCTKCLVYSDNPLLLCPVFFNDSALVEPLDPGKEPESFFEAYLQTNIAIWMDTPELYKRAWQRILKVLDQTSLFEIQPIEALQPLIDLIDRGVELDLMEDPHSAVTELEKRVRQSPDDATLEAALTLHESEGRLWTIENAVEDQGKAPPNQRPPSVHKPAAGNKSARPPNRTGRHLNSVPGPGDEVPLVSKSLWLERRETTRTTSRRKSRHFNFEDSNSTWRWMESILREQPGDRVLVQLKLPGSDRAWLLRGSLIGRTHCALQVGADHPELVRKALAILLALARSDQYPHHWRELIEATTDSIRVLTESKFGDARPNGLADMAPLSNARMDSDGFGWVEFRLSKTR